MAKQLIVINAGSSSIKFAAFDFDQHLNRNTYGSIENITSAPVLKIIDNAGNIAEKKEYKKPEEYNFFYDFLFSYFASTGAPIHAVGHRVVHGANKYQQPVVVNEEVVKYLKTLIPFAPLHQPYNIEAIEVITKLHPEVTQVACFDTAFHCTHYPVADRFGIPRELHDVGIRRYGFHGLSYEYIMTQLREIAPNKALGRIIVAHLGNGASMCAINNGQSIDSSMGFTALDGLLMGTRCGSIDPGVLLFLLQARKMSDEALVKLLYHQSGLFGVSGISSNMQVLLNDASPTAKEAVDLFVFRAQRELGALSAVLKGLDMLIFTGGIGENAPAIREKICQDMNWIGLKIDREKNSSNKPIISPEGASIQICVIPTNEEKIIANHTYRLVHQ
ncbi:MAG: acetate/propionate family kinase [Proteobacteria bacterium]|nr:acetate/propionate family kinase [Pseudomonadota bacterium]